jgi:hypothetical protein
LVLLKSSVSPGTGSGTVPCTVECSGSSVAFPLHCSEHSPVKFYSIQLMEL